MEVTRLCPIQQALMLSRPCLWISAGLLTYKLCDRDFNCDCCPLDAALGGASSGSFRREALLVPSCRARLFPDDRLYTTSHAWVRSVGAAREDRLFRVGLDAFAAAIVGRCREVTCHVSERSASRRGRPSAKSTLD